MRYPGEVYYLQPSLYEPEGKGGRPHVLLSAERAEIDTVTLAYGSTSRKDAARGAEHVFLDPRGGRYRGTGLVRPTYIYSSRLVQSLENELEPAVGRLTHELPALRASLVRSLGLGTGVTHEPNGWGYNRRGRVVELDPEFAEEWEVTHAVAVTEPDYSRTGYLQTVVPLLDDSFTRADVDVELPDTAWLKYMAPHYRRGFLAVSMISTVFAPDHVARFLGLVITPDLMAQVDRALVAHFGLQDYV